MSSWNLGRTITETLIDAGVEHVVVCPGSRNTPLSLAVSQADRAGRLRLHTRTDERDGGFLALGLAKVAGIAAVVVTSGTAVGNLMPAVMEAYASQIPLLVITADRPATLIGSGANQTTDQLGLFGAHVVGEVRLASADAAPRAWTAQLRRGIVAARGLRSHEPGPVHVNAAFAEPLVPDDSPAPKLASFDVPPLMHADPTWLEVGPATAVLCGDATPEIGQRAAMAAEGAQVPLFAEPSSNARHSSAAVPGYQRLLADDHLAAQIERLVVYGHPTLNRSVTKLLGRADLDVVVVAPNARWIDPQHSARAVLDDVVIPPSDGALLASWQERSRRLTDQPDESWSPNSAVHAVLAHSGNCLFIGSSNTVRALDQAPTWPSALRTYANRGLAGIDGTIATATGIALASAAPVTAVMGDLTFLHDVGALMIPAGQPVPDLRIVVLDDDGGAIFASLEVGAPDYAADFDRVFTMPHGHDLAAIAAGFGVPVADVTTIDELNAELAAPISGLSVVVARLVS